MELFVFLMIIAGITGSIFIFCLYKYLDEIDKKISRMAEVMDDNNMSMKNKALDMCEDILLKLDNVNKALAMLDKQQDRRSAANKTRLNTIRDDVKKVVKKASKKK